MIVQRSSSNRSHLRFVVAPVPPGLRILGGAEQEDGVGRVAHGSEQRLVILWVVEQRLETRVALERLPTE